MRCDLVYQIFLQVVKLIAMPIRAVVIMDYVRINMLNSFYYYYPLYPIIIQA